jgi:hypothetical protein
MRRIGATALMAAAALISGCGDGGSSRPDAARDQGASTEGRRLDGPTTDSRRADRSITPDGTTALPGCPSGCGAEEVCWSTGSGFACKPTGPSKSCGTQKYGSGLPSSGVIYVDGSYSGAGTGTEAQPFKTIGDALKAVSSTAKIVAVAQGSYTEDLTITSSVELRCRCADQVTIAGKVAVPPAGLTSDLTVVIDGCRIAGPGPSSCTDGNPSALSVKNISYSVAVLVRDSVLTGWCSGLTFSLDRTLPLTGALPLPLVCVTRSRLTGNKFSGVELWETPKPSGSSAGWPGGECGGIKLTAAVELSQVTSNQTGILAWGGASEVALAGSLISRNGAGTSPTGRVGMGVYLGNAVAAELRANRIEDNESHGVGLFNLTTVPGVKIVSTENLMSGNRGTALKLQQLQASQAVEISKNFIHGTQKLPGAVDGDGIQVTVNGGTSFAVDIKDNTIKNSARNGIVLDGVGGGVANNTISGSAAYGVALQNNATATIGTNAFSGNLLGDQVKRTSAGDICSDLPVPMP